MPPRRIATVCLVTACILLIAGLLLCFDNPTVDIAASDVGGRGPAGRVGCSIAPWDAGLNHDQAGPGGEHSGPYYDEVAAECYSANTTRFDAAAGSGIVALLMIGASVMLATRPAAVEEGSAHSWPSV